MTRDARFGLPLSLVEALRADPSPAAATLAELLSDDAPPKRPRRAGRWASAFAGLGLAAACAAAGPSYAATAAPSGLEGRWVMAPQGSSFSEAVTGPAPDRVVVVVSRDAPRPPGLRAGGKPRRPRGRPQRLRRLARRRRRVAQPGGGRGAGHHRRARAVGRRPAARPARGCDARGDPRPPHGSGHRRARARGGGPVRPHAAGAAGPGARTAPPPPAVADTGPTLASR